MMRRAYALLALSGVMVSACTVGPNFRPPATPPTASAPFVSSVQTANSTAAPPEDWWRLYNDPVLDRLIARAFAANTDLRVAEANLSEARAVLREARVGLLPSTTFSGGADYGRSSSANAAAASSAALNSAFGGTGANTAALGPTTARASEIYDAAFDASYEIDLFGRVRRTIEAARGDARAEAAARDAVKITVAAETARAYVDGCAYAAEIVVANQSLKVVQDTYDITVVRRDAGAASDFDTARQAALLEQTKRKHPAASRTETGVSVRTRRPSGPHPLAGSCRGLRVQDHTDPFRAYTGGRRRASAEAPPGHSPG